MEPGGGRQMASKSKSQHWGDRASQMRELAGKMTDPNAAVLLTDLAEHYDQEAKEAAAKPRQINGKQS
jgi:hypothetical protein